MKEVFKRELKAYFTSVITYIVGALILLTCGIRGTVNLSGFVGNFEYSVQSASWIYLVVLPLLGLKMSARAWAAKGLAKSAGSPLSDSFSKKLMKPSDQDTADAVFYEEALAKGQISCSDLVLGRFFAQALLLLAPVLLLHLYPLIFLYFHSGDIAAAIWSIWVFYLLGLVLLGGVNLLVARQERQIFSFLSTIICLLFCYYLETFASFCVSPLSSFLFLTLLAALLGLGVLLLSHRGWPALITAGAAEAAVLLLFILNRAQPQGLAWRAVRRVSVYERFFIMAGGELDGFALVYFLCLITVFLAGTILIVQEGREGARLKGRVLVTAGIVTAALFALSLCTGRALKFDITRTGQGRETPEFEEVLDNVQDPVTVYWIVQNGEEDGAIRTLLDLYSSGCRKLTIVKLQPSQQKDFLSEHISDSIYNNSMLVTNGVRYRYINFNDIYTYVTSETGDGEKEISLLVNLENLLGHAVSYVSGQTDGVKLGVTQGHGETALPDTFLDAVKADDVTTEDLTLPEIPSDTALILINAPQEDLSAEEENALKAYLEGGGKLLAVTDPSVDPDRLPNLCALLKAYGLEIVKGTIAESGSALYASDDPETFYTTRVVHEITSDISDVLVSSAGALLLTSPGGVTTTPLLVSSEEATLSSDADENGLVQAPFTVAALSEKGEAKILLEDSASFFSDSLNTKGSGSSADLFEKEVSFLTSGATSWTELDARAFNLTLLSTTDLEKTRIGLLFIGMIPLLYLVIGLIFWGLKRRAQLLAQEEAEEAARQAEASSTSGKGRDS